MFKKMIVLGLFAAGVSSVSFSDESLVSLYTPNTIVSGTDESVATGLQYAIGSVHLGSGWYLDSRDQGLPVRVYHKDLANNYRRWIFEPIQGENDQYAINSVHLGAGWYLDSGNTNQEVKVVHKDLANNYRRWTFVPVEGVDGQYGINSVQQGAGWYLDSRDSGRDVKVVHKNLTSTDYRRWTFQPIDYTLFVRLTDFVFPDSQSILDKNARFSFIEHIVLDIDESSVGTSISQTFTKTLTDTFSFGFNQKLTISVAAETRAYIPFLGGGSVTITATGELGANQSWSSSEQNTVSTTITLVKTGDPPALLGRHP